MATTVLIIDDDQKLNRVLSRYLGQFGMSVLTAEHPDAGLRLLRDKFPSLVILDLMLPGRDGLAVCKEIRRECSIPIIMLTARGDLSDRVAGLELGADDYLSKPFEPRELVARIQTVLRRSERGESEPTKLNWVRVEDLTVDLQRRTASLHSKALTLTTTEFELLVLFLHNPGTILSREAIMDRTRGINWEAYNRVIDVTMSRLRHKLKDNPKEPRYFKTVWGTGYLFLPTPHFLSEDPLSA